MNVLLFFLFSQCEELSQRKQKCNHRTRETIKATFLQSVYRADYDCCNRNSKAHKEQHSCQHRPFPLTGFKSLVERCYELKNSVLHFQVNFLFGQTVFEIISHPQHLVCVKMMMTLLSRGSLCRFATNKFLRHIHV